MKRYISLASLALVFILFAVPTHVGAQGVQDFVITSFSADYELTNEDPQGLLKVTETIELDYSGQNRGILRAVPDTYEGSDLNLRVVAVQRDGSEEPYITYEENDNIVIQIGDANTYLTGPHSYVINYEVENVILFFDTHDEFFWDVNGDQWQQEFLSVDATVTSSAPRGDLDVICFAGVYGSDGTECETKEEASGFSARTTRAFGPNETLTIAASYQKGFFTPLPWWEQYENLFFVSPLVIFQGLIVRSARKQWKLYGKDHKRRGVVAPFFGRPKGVSVMQASYVADNKLTPKHVSAAIIDLAIRGYVKITEKKDGRKIKHELTLLKKVDNQLTADEKKLLGSLIGQNVGDHVELESKKNKLYKTFEELKKIVDDKTAKKGYYELSPKKAASKLGKQVGLGIVGVIAGFILANVSSGLTAATGVVAMVIIGIYAALMTKRSASGNLLDEHMEGLKLYLSKAEKDRIAQQDAVEAPLAPRSGAPERTVEFFEKLLPFAVAAGVEKSWAQAFEDMYTQPPDWYSGRWNTFSTVALASSLSSTSKAATTSFTAPSSSGSSGFSGGGFSGGGGGGGGGGGW